MLVHVIEHSFSTFVKTFLMCRMCRDAKMTREMVVYFCTV